MAVYVSWIVVGLPIRIKFPSTKVESNVSKVHFFQIGSLAIFQSNCSKVLCSSLRILSAERSGLFLELPKLSSL